MMKGVSQVYLWQGQLTIWKIDHSKSDEEETKWGRLKDLKSLIGPKKHASGLVIPLDIVKDDIVRQAQYSGKEYKIRARPRSYLLSIIALQAVEGRFPEISKKFEAALVGIRVLTRISFKIE